MFVAKWYTRASRVRIVIAKFDGRWKLPGGPYTVPELSALVVGVLSTLFLLPRMGQPLLTAVVGVGATAFAVASMRMMPYSPVNFGTRIHRIGRLYSSPISFSTDELAHGATAVSTVRPQIEVLDLHSDPVGAYGAGRGARIHPVMAPESESDGWADMFGQQRSAAAELFG